MKIKAILFFSAALATAAPALVFARGSGDDFPLKLMQEVFKQIPVDGITEDSFRKDRGDRESRRDGRDDNDASRTRSRDDGEGRRDRNRDDKDASRTRNRDDGEGRRGRNRDDGEGRRGRNRDGDN